MSSPVVIRLEILNLDLLNEPASISQMESRNEQHSTINHLMFSMMTLLMFMLLILIYSTLPTKLSRMIIIPILLVLQYLVAIYQGAVFPIR